MVTGKCEFCGVDEYMPFVCKFCRARFCVSHRLPENHHCRGLEGYRERMRAEGRIMAPEPGVMRPSVSPSARAGARLNAFFERYQGKFAFGLLGVMAAVFVLQLAMRFADAHALEDTLFLLDRDVLLEPWTVVTSIVAHADFNHFFLNGLVFFFFGPTLERLIGSRRFVYLFILGGIVAGLAQLVVFNVLLPAYVPAFAHLARANILGASGGIQALLGTLTMLAPRLQVLVMFVVPAPLWAITAFYAFLDFALLFDSSSGIAHLAHLVGLGLGLAYGRRLHQRGLRVHMQQPTPMYRRSW